LYQRLDALGPEYYVRADYVVHEGQVQPGQQEMRLAVAPEKGLDLDVVFVAWGVVVGVEAV
jgi:hypothetical protein